MVEIIRRVREFVLNGDVEDEERIEGDGGDEDCEDNRWEV